MLLRARQFEFSFPRPALVMAIVNVTPDSFSDGGTFLEADRAVAHALKLVAQGADIIDIGGESTRPGATPVSEREELNRVIPVIEKLAGRISVPISIDTMKPSVARAAISAGASIVNDVAANRCDEAMARLIAETSAGYIATHMQGTPETMQQNPIYTDVVREVDEFFSAQMDRLKAAGVSREQIILDVGIGFGKTTEHNLELLRNIKVFTKWNRPLLTGISRKSFLGRMLAANVTERLPASLACDCWTLGQGVKIFRTHDVAETKLALRATELLLNHGSVGNA